MQPLQVFSNPHQLTDIKAVYRGSSLHKKGSVKSPPPKKKPTQPQNMCAKNFMRACAQTWDLKGQKF